MVPGDYSSTFDNGIAPPPTGRKLNSASWNQTPSPRLPAIQRPTPAASSTSSATAVMPESTSSVQTALPTTLGNQGSNSTSPTSKNEGYMSSVMMPFLIVIGIFLNC